jgi:hypothetical protein
MFLLTLEIDTPAGSRKALYLLRKLTIFNGILIFETRLVDEMPSMQSISAPRLLTTIGDATYIISWRSTHNDSLPRPGSFFALQSRNISSVSLS